LYEQRGFRPLIRLNIKSDRLLRARSRRSITVRLTTASNRRMSGHRVTPLKSLKHLHFGNGGFRDVVQT
ncbi:hypothetical protein, partial [Ruegeria sp. PrR005]|uniref:hypothetical protein n=1 Tax=Ruegeria sp. PrR005 TaxID=2706882 RepID=UPI001942A706